MLANEGEILGEEEWQAQECYQCQKCSAGCPVAEEMDLKPHQVMHWLAMGQKGKVISCKTIWVCASCYTCSTRCPNDLDIAGIMDGLRQIALKEGVKPIVPEVAVFHETFLSSVRDYGRIHELSLMAKYKLKTGHWFEDLKLGWQLWTKGKLKLWPRRVKRKKEIRELFLKK